jgi:hypothetical protein
MKESQFTYPEPGNPKRLEALMQDLSIVSANIAAHLYEKHNGLPASTCHRCITLTATYQDLQLLITMEQKEKTI